MKFRGLLFAAILLAALSGVLYWSNRHKPAETVQATTADTPPDILKLNDADITHVDIKKKTGPELVLAKDNQGKWEIDSPQKLPADQSAVSGVISSLASLPSERLVEDKAKAEDLSQFGLNAPEMEVDVTDKKGAHKLLVGDTTPTNSGAYAKLENDPRIFTIASYTKGNLDKTLNDLRDKRLLNIEPDKVTRLELRSNNQEIEFGRDKDQWQVLKPKPMRADGYAVDDVVRKLGDAKMDFSPADDEKKIASAFASAKPVAQAKVTTNSGTEQLDLRKNKDDYYAKSSQVSGIYKVPGDLGQALDKKVDDFRNKKLFEFGYTDPDKIEIDDGSKKYFLTKGGSDWFGADGKKLDVSGAELLLDKLRDLQATKFADSAPGTSNIHITVISNSGKHTEKVSLAKQGEDYIGKRDDAPDMYVLDAKSVDAVTQAAADLKPAPAAKK